LPILKKDHDKVKELFDRFEKEESKPAGRRSSSRRSMSLSACGPGGGDILSDDPQQVGEDSDERGGRRASRSQAFDRLNWKTSRMATTIATRKFTVLRKRTTPHQGRRKRSEPKAKEHAH